MIPSSSLSAKDRLRRTKSTRSIRRTRQPSFILEPFDPDLARSQAMAAATQAMRRSHDRSSIEYNRRSYDRLGGPENLAVPPRRRPENNASSTDESSPQLSTVCYVENQDTYPAALPSINEFGGLDGRMSSLPSSYRRLRKAKSMFSTRQRASHVPYGGISSERYSSPVASQEGSTDTVRPYGTLRRSMSFLKGGSQRTRSVRHAKSQDAAIQLARTQFAQSRKPSLATLRPRREQKPFRKTFRTTSESVTEAGGTPVSERSKNGGAIQGKARSLSSSIKKGLKRVLGLSKTTDEPTPAQESLVQTQWNYPPSSTGSSANPEYMAGSDYSYYNSPDQERFASPARPPTMRSTRSSESLATSRSRVTSWADSTAPNTVTTRRAGDPNSLSIIDENGTATPIGQSKQGRPTTSVEGQRLYSALMKHIGRTQADDTDEQIVLGRVKEQRAIPERTSSLRTCRSKQTLRRIPSDESMHSPLSFTTANGNAITPQRQRARQSKRQVHQHASRYTQNKENDRPEDTSSVRRQPLDSLFEIGEDSDESGSVIVDRSKNADADSPSIYSRTTSGDSPTRNDQIADHVAEPKEEPGMAMIYESQRSVYSSPKRAARSGSTATAQPSADWQRWMNSQIARIEHTPTREHYREDAQIHDDDETNHINALALGLSSGRDTVKQFNPSVTLSETGDFSINNKAPAQNNFSRPFSRSSSVRSVAKSQNSYAADSKDLGHGSSLSLRSTSRRQTPDSPTPKRNTTESQQRGMSTRQYRRYQASRMSMARDAKSVPFRSIRDQRDNGMNDENQSGYSPISSKRMVDSFLDSRRRPIEMEMPSDDGVPAFI